MTINKMFAGAVALAVLATAVPEAAQRRFQETITVKSRMSRAQSDHMLTFNTAVALPGISLGAGTYIFRHPSSNALQVAAADGTPYAMFLTIPTTRMNPTDGYSLVVEAPSAAGSPRRIVAVFAPGEVTGQEFVYPNR